MTMDTASGQTRDFVFRHAGIAAALTAVVGFAVGSVGAYRLVHETPAPPILLRQSLQAVSRPARDVVPGQGGYFVVLRNDSVTSVEVIEAAFARTTNAPSLFTATQIVAPGADATVFVAVPSECQDSVGLTISFDSADSVKPVQILVRASRPGGPPQSVPVEVTGELAVAMKLCHQTG